MTYVQKVREATEALVAQKLLLQKDADILLEKVGHNISMH